MFGDRLEDCLDYDFKYSYKLPKIGKFLPNFFKIRVYKNKYNNNDKIFNTFYFFF